MDRKNIIIILSVILLLLGASTVFVYKAKGSNGKELVSGCIPYNVSISKEDSYKASIEWSTTDECLGYIMYGNDRENLDYIGLDQERISSIKHMVTIEGLHPAQNYYFLIYSGENSYGYKGLPLSFSLSSL
jgi:hypothetical protein